MTSQVTGLETEIEKAHSTLRAVGVESLAWRLLTVLLPGNAGTGTSFPRRDKGQICADGFSGVS
jgi:hypothetical protein